MFRKSYKKQKNLLENYKNLLYNEVWREEVHDIKRRNKKCIT